MCAATTEASLRKRKRIYRSGGERGFESCRGDAFDHLACSPWQNGFVEKFYCKLRDECLDREAFLTLRERQVCLEGHRSFYNEQRPHSSFGYIVHAAFKHKWEKLSKQT